MRTEVQTIISTVGPRLGIGASLLWCVRMGVWRAAVINDIGQQAWMVRSGSNATASKQKTLGLGLTWDLTSGAVRQEAVGVAKFNIKSSLFYFSSWELACPFTPFLAMFLVYFVDSPGGFTLHVWMKCFLLSLLISQVEVDLSLRTNGLAHWRWKLELTIPLSTSDSHVNRIYATSPSFPMGLMGWQWWWVWKCSECQEVAERGKLISIRSLKNIWGKDEKASCSGPHLRRAWESLRTTMENLLSLSFP